MLEFLKNGKGEILNFFFKNPDGVYYFREIAKSLNKEPAYYQRHLDSLVEDGILEDERKGNLRFFKLNKCHPLYNELKSIISKTIGLQYRLQELVNIFPNVECAFIFGSMAKNQEVADSDIDLMVIGNLDVNLFTEKIVLLERDLRREINYHIFNKGEIIKKLEEKDSFFMNVFNNEMIILKGNVNDYANFIRH